MCRLLLLTLATGLAAGCPAAGTAGAPPAQGSMRVLSAKELITPWREIPNLLPNGGFSEWYAGAPVLRGFDFPGDPLISEVHRRVLPGGQAAEQVWRAPDGGLPPQGLFRSTLRGIKPDTTYRFEVNAVAKDPVGAQVSIGVWGWGKGGVTILARPLFRLEGVPGARVTRAGHFTTKDEPMIIIGAYLDQPVENEARVLWLEWRLTEGAAD